MLKTLKGKFLIVYLLLVFILAVVGATSIANIYSLGKSIQGLMTDNYKSINAAGYMLDALEGQNSAALTYINTNKNKGISDFNKNSGYFYQWYNVEASNITEKNEKQFVEDINNSYTAYLTLFSRLQETAINSDNSKVINFYNDEMYPEYSNLKKLLRDLSILNEKAMFSGKERVINASEKSMNIVIILSVLSIIGGLTAAWLSLIKFLSPLYALRDNMKALKEGELNKQTKIVSQDEIGELSKEFNDMTKRLMQFEQSTLGKVLAEKNKSLAIVKSISDPIIVMDTNYKIVLINEAFEQLFNLEEKIVLNKYFLEVVRNGELYDYIKNIYNSEEDKIEQKIFYFNYNSKDYYYNVLVTRLRETDNKRYGLVVLFQNVTGLKEIEKLKSDFIATVSHEFKTPLTSIMMGASLIGDEAAGGLSKKQQEIVETINEESEKLLNLVNNLLHLSKLESSKSIFNIEDCTIEAIVENSIKSFVSEAKERNISLQYNPIGSSIKVKVDFDKTLWVLNNLISNALKFTEAGDKILIRSFVKQNRMCVSVKDTGKGIPEDYVEKIFEKFVQVKGTEDRGTGLGLSIAKEIVEAQGGEIWCESELHEGSIFTFTLPLEEKF
ncbi:MCP four helix bundle domain-containing protein [Clostridium sp. YIM B02515]|uniref:histidine kinase n=1 Tax=Clostridium rhizosphaerae TaxID=2803861 RepID=A0ABS1T9F2_9CLOT|nr:ATP-binding protein [Clostridium rhizosphaerae]MBL4935970.1 MCP four helix bundle domain-containing protein [Clostridium rhizosphaerae]